jgi:replication initiation and membrane attachment protein DnaB
MSMLKEMMAKDSVARREATWKQRKVLYDLYTELKWDLRGIRDLSVDAASRRIDEAIEALGNKKEETPDEP